MPLCVMENHLLNPGPAVAPNSSPSLGRQTNLRCEWNISANFPNNAADPGWDYLTQGGCNPDNHPAFARVRCFVELSFDFFARAARSPNLQQPVVKTEQKLSLINAQRRTLVNAQKATFNAVHFAMPCFNHHWP